MHRRTSVALLAGVVPLAWFLLWTAIGGWSAPGYSGIAQHASELLQAGPIPALSLRIAAVGSGLAFIVFGMGVWSRSRMPVALGAVAWMLFGVAMLSNGIWPMGDPRHGLYGIGMANLVAPALTHVELAPHLSARRYYRLTAFVSAAGILYLWMNLTGHDPQAYRGLTQRVFSSINALWPFVVAHGLARSVESAQV